MTTWDTFIELLKTQFEPMIGRFGFRRLIGYESGYADESGVVLYYENDDPLRVVIDNLRQSRYEQGQVTQFYWVRVKVGRQNLKQWLQRTTNHLETNEGWIYTRTDELPHLFREIITALENYLQDSGRQAANPLTWFYNLAHARLQPLLQTLGFQRDATQEVGIMTPMGDFHALLTYRHARGYEIVVDMVQRTKKDTAQRTDFLWVRVKVGGDDLKKWLYPHSGGDRYEVVGWKHYDDQPFEGVLDEIQQGLAQYLAAYGTK